MPLTPIPNGELRVGGVVLLDLDRVAHELHVSTRSVRRLISTGELAAMLHGGRRMVAESEIVDYLVRQTAAAARQRSARARAHRNADRAVAGR